MKNLFSKLANIPKDKLLHFFYGTLISHFLLTVGVTHFDATILLLSVAVAKEAWDNSQPGGKYSFIDILFTLLPMLLLIILELVRG